MKRILFVIIAFLILSCKNYNIEPVQSKWIIESYESYTNNMILYYCTPIEDNHKISAGIILSPTYLCDSINAYKIGDTIVK